MRHGSFMDTVARGSRPKPAGGRSQVRATQAYPQRYVEENERERPRRARAMDAAVAVAWIARAVWRARLESNQRPSA